MKRVLINKWVSVIIALVVLVASVFMFTAFVNAPQISATEGDAAEVILNDSVTSYATFESAWNAAYKLGVSEDNRPTVKLLNNITAIDESFGLGLGFISGSIAVREDRFIKLDLNGFTINRNLTQAKSNGSVITVYGDLILSDSVGSGVITGGYNTSGGGGVNVFPQTSDAKAKFVMNGGAIKANKTKSEMASGGGGVNVSTFTNESEATFIMNGGKIQGNTSTLNGGGIDSYASIVTINGGEISENNAGSRNYGGGIYAKNTKLKVGACSISGNTARYGAGIYLDATPAVVAGTKITNNIATDIGAGIFAGNNTITLKDAQITQNFTTKANNVGAGVRAHKTIYVSGNTIISDNYSGATLTEGKYVNGKADNLFLVEKINIGDASQTPQFFNGNIGVTTNAAPNESTDIALTDGWGSSMGTITSDNASYSVANFGGEKTLIIAYNYNVTHALTNITATENSAGEGAAGKYKEYTTQLTAADNYRLPSDIIVKINGNILEESKYVYDNINGKLSIYGDYVVGDIEITAIAASSLITDITIGETSFVYDGNGHKIVVNGMIAGDEIYYRMSTVGEYSATNPSFVNAGKYKVYFKIVRENCNDYVSGATITIEKANIDMSEISFNGAKYIYNGNARSLAITGELPQGVIVNYDGNNQSNAGVYTVKAIFTYDEQNYNAIEDLTAVLTIEKANIDMSGITFENAKFIYDGTQRNITVNGILPEQVTVSYEGNNQTLAGVYGVKAIFNYDKANYNAIDDLSATMTILADKLVGNIDIAGETFEIIVTKNGGFEPDIVLVIATINSAKHPIYNVSDSKYVQRAYNISLKQNGEEITTEQELEVKLSIPKSMQAQAFLLQQYSNGQSQEIKYSISDGYASFTTNNLGDFGFIAEIIKGEQAPLAWVFILLSIVLMLLFIILLIIILKKIDDKRNTRGNKQFR